MAEIKKEATTFSLIDVIRALQVAAGMTPATIDFRDVNGDSVLGIAEAISIMKKL